jgi:hypothetical protein
LQEYIVLSQDSLYLELYRPVVRDGFGNYAGPQDVTREAVNLILVVEELYNELNYNPLDV